MKCPICGAESNGKFCPGCGMQMDSVVQPTAKEVKCEPNIDAPEEHPSNGTNFISKYWRKILPIVIATAITLLAFTSSVQELMASYDLASIILGIALMWGMIYFGINLFLKRKNYTDAPRSTSFPADAHAQKKAELDKEGIVYCPRCLCTSISADKKGFGIGKAVIGSSVIKHPIGLVAGNIGAKKVRCTCLKCGYSWIAGKQ